jgi:hypothetical protein
MAVARDSWDTEVDPAKVETALKALVARLRSESAVLRRERRADLVAFEIAPASSRAAGILVEVEDDGSRAYLTIGKGIHLEIDRDTSTEEPPLALLVLCCKAAIEGRVSETLWVRLGKRWRVDGAIQLPDRTVRTSTSEAFGLGRLLPSKRETYRYEPYETGG